MRTLVCSSSPLRTAVETEDRHGLHEPVRVGWIVKEQVLVHPGGELDVDDTPQLILSEGGRRWVLEEPRGVLANENLPDVHQRIRPRAAAKSQAGRGIYVKIRSLGGVPM